MKNAQLKPMHRNSPPSSEAMRLPLQMEVLGLNQKDVILAQADTSCRAFGVRFSIIPAYRTVSNFSI